jgi:SRSO17 transposase
MPAGVARMYTGTAGRAENSQAGVFAAYVTPDGGRALTGRELYLPEKQTDDRDRCRAAGIGDDAGFATRPELARRMAEPCMAAFPSPGSPATRSTAGNLSTTGTPARPGWPQRPARRRPPPDVPRAARPAGTQPG